MSINITNIRELPSIEMTVPRDQTIYPKKIEKLPPLKKTVLRTKLSDLHFNLQRSIFFFSTGKEMRNFELTSKSFSLFFKDDRSRKLWFAVMKLKNLKHDFKYSEKLNYKFFFTLFCVNVYPLKTIFFESHMSRKENEKCKCDSCSKEETALVNKMFSFCKEKPLENPLEHILFFNAIKNFSLYEEMHIDDRIKLKSLKEELTMRRHYYNNGKLLFWCTDCNKEVHYGHGNAKKDRYSYNVKCHLPRDFFLAFVEKY